MGGRRLPDKATSPPTKAHFASVDPILAVDDLTAALDYYRNTLGFEIAWTFGDPVQLASVCRDGVAINLSMMQPGAFGPSRIYVHITGIDAYYAGVVAAGANVTIAIGNRDYGMRDFRVVDPDGNQISFGEAFAGL